MGQVGVKKIECYKYQDNLRLIKALAMAEGFSDIEYKKSVSIVRKINNREQEITNISLDYHIMPDDVIVVYENFSKS